MKAQISVGLFASIYEAVKHFDTLAHYLQKNTILRRRGRYSVAYEILLRIVRRK